MTTADQNNVEITPSELEALAPGSFLLIDTRDQEEYDHGFIPGCLHYSPEQVLTRAESGAFRDGRKIVLYCKYGKVTRELADTLRGYGCASFSLQGGYGSWALHAIQIQAQNDNKREEIEHSIQKRFHNRLMGPFVRAITRYSLIREGDHIAVCISGGKDSMLMAKLFQELLRHGQFSFDLTFLVMDPGYNEANRKIIENNAALLGIPAVFFETRIFDAVYTIESSPCYLCARMRRGYLYRKAKELGCNKIALGHHFDDVIETALMGMLYSGQWAGMLPKLHSTNFTGMELIRPMYFVREDDIKLWRDENDLHFIQCACRFTETCTTCAEDGQSVSKRLETKQLIASLKKNNPQVETNIFHATENVSIDKLLGYRKDGIRHSFLDHYDEEL